MQFSVNNSQVIILNSNSQLDFVTNHITEHNNARKFYDVRFLCTLFVLTEPYCKTYRFVFESCFRGTNKSLFSSFSVCFNTHNVFFFYTWLKCNQTCSLNFFFFSFFFEVLECVTKQLCFLVSQKSSNDIVRGF